MSAAVMARRRMVRLGASRLGAAGEAWLGAEGCVTARRGSLNEAARGEVSHVRAGLGGAGMACLGRERQGVDRLGRHGKAPHGESRFGWAVQAGLGGTGRGRAAQVESRRGMAVGEWQCKARRVAASLCLARLGSLGRARNGMAGPGYARRGVAGVA